MTLLRRIQDATIDPNSRLADILRMCKILAFRLDHPLFKDWIERELNGYTDLAQMPDYRILKNLQSRGHFSGSFGSGMKNAPIPMSSLPEEIRDFVSTRQISESISSIENTVAQANRDNEGTLSSSWVPDILPLVGGNIYQSMFCLDASTVIPTSKFVAILDTVKTRILDFVLELETASLNIGGDKMIEEQQISRTVINQIFNKCILHSQTATDGSIIQTEERNSMTEPSKYDFRGAQVAGGVAETVQGSQIGGTINNNGASLNEIAHLLSRLREQAQCFPDKCKDEAIDVLDDLEADIRKPEVDTGKIGRRLKSFFMTASAASAIAGSTAAFSSDLKSITQNVMDLTELFGIPSEQVLPAVEVPHFSQE